MTPLSTQSLTLPPMWPSSCKDLKTKLRIQPRRRTAHLQVMFLRYLSKSINTNLLFTYSFSNSKSVLHVSLTADPSLFESFPHLLVGGHAASHNLKLARAETNRVYFTASPTSPHDSGLASSAGCKALWFCAPYLFAKPVVEDQPNFGRTSP